MQTHCKNRWIRRQKRAFFSNQDKILTYSKKK
jgi:hypothetical protein